MEYISCANCHLYRASRGLPRCQYTSPRWPVISGSDGSSSVARSRYPTAFCGSPSLKCTQPSESTKNPLPGRSSTARSINPIACSRLRPSSHRWEVERGRYRGIALGDRLCRYCPEKEIDDGWSDGYYQQIRSFTKNINIRNIVNLSVGCLIAYLSVPIIANLASPSQAMNRSFDPFRIVNTYGAFGRWDLYLNTWTGHIKGHHLYNFSGQQHKRLSDNETNPFVEIKCPTATKTITTLTTAQTTFSKWLTTSDFLKKRNNRNVYF